MKRLIIILFLSGCYSAKDDCYYGMTRICNGELYPYIAHYQKPYSLGKTDSIQRRKDIENCGGFFSENDSINYKIKGLRDEDNRIIRSVVEEFENCMKRKGYIYLSNDECGRKNSRSDKGVCNE